MQCRLEEGLQQQHHRALDPLVLEAGLASRPLLPVVRLDPYPLDWRRAIPLIAPPLVQVPEVVVEVLSLRLGRHLLHPRCTVFTGLSLGCQQERTGNHVQHLVAPHRWIALGLLGHALECHGDAW